VVRNPVTAEAMQSRAFASRLLEPMPPFIHFSAAYPSGIVDWPDIYIAIA